MEVKLFRVSHIVQACARLRIFCIDNREDSAPLILNHDPESFHPNFEAFVPPVQTWLTASARFCVVQEANHAQLASGGLHIPI
jgi:hypothetical protein